MTDRRGLERTAKAALIIAILVYGAALRLVAVTEIFGPVSSPGWLRSTQQSLAASAAWRPAGLHWQPTEVFPHRDAPPSRYRSDPYTYLQYAREMRSFSAAHRREPLFPFATKGFLRLLADQDVAVSFTSATFSALAIAATFLLGARAFGYWTGAAAALLMAIEYDLITWGVAGFRDEAFMFGVLSTCVALLYFRQHPGWGSGLALGLAAGTACLIRITSLSFVGPAVAAVALLPGTPSRQRAAGAAACVAAIVCLTGPYLVNCWRVYGDPLYSINVHASVYREAEGRPGDANLTVRAYLGDQLRRRPIAALDTIVQGLTVYPFANKWTGFGAWQPLLGRMLSFAAVAGLLLWVAHPAGRLLLLVLVCSLVPYAATWKLIADWRFTEHAYPFFLMAAAAAVSMAIGGVRLVGRRDELRVKVTRMHVIWVSGACAAVALVWFVAVRFVPVWIANETLRTGDPVVITALDRDAAFFTSGWTAGPGGTIPTRVTTEQRAEIRVPLPERAGYELLLRVDPAPTQIAAGEPVAGVQLLLNGRLLARCDPGSAADRIGTCRLRVPADAVRPGMNRLTLVSDASPARGFRVWYLRLQRAAG